MQERPGGAAGMNEVPDQIHDLRMQDGWDLKVFPRCRRAGEDKDAAANDGADPEGRKGDGAKRLLKPRLRVLGVCDQLVNGFFCEQLGSQRVAPPLEGTGPQLSCGPDHS